MMKESESDPVAGSVWGWDNFMSDHIVKEKGGSATLSKEGKLCGSHSSQEREFEK